MTVINTTSLAADIDRAVNGEPSQLVEATAALSNAALDAVTGADRAGIAVLRAQVDRLRRRLARHDHQAGAVPERLLASLDRPRRPGDLARLLGLDPSQVSRGLRALIDGGHISEVATPPGGDGRGRWYQQR